MVLDGQDLASLLAKIKIVNGRTLARPREALLLKRKSFRLKRKGFKKILDLKKHEKKLGKKGIQTPLKLHSTQVE